jgi:hypothetical protein
MLPIKRGLKFRIWDNQGAKYLEKVESFIIELVPETTGKTFEYKEDDQTNFTFQQSTGMMTDDGQELFEGDIIEFVWTGLKRLAQIKYKLGAYTCEIIEKESGTTFYWLHAIIMFDCPIKIVGNIKENPELLIT